jgi:uncharacterized protein (TIGR03000 family)
MYYTPGYAPPPPLATTLNKLPPVPLGGLERATAEPAPQLPPPAANGVAHFTVKLPVDAKLWVNDVETKPAGISRRFHTPNNLEPGKKYEYTFKAQWTENTQSVTRDRNIRFSAGDDLTVDFGDSTQPPSP